MGSNSVWWPSFIVGIVAPRIFGAIHALLLPQFRSVPGSSLAAILQAAAFYLFLIALNCSSSACPPYVPELSNVSVWIGLAWAVGGHAFAGIIYRLFLSPLASIPGPRLAALTSWYEFYYDVIKPGQYVFKIKDLHEEYGNDVSHKPVL